MAEVTTLHDLFIDRLQDVYYAEKKILAALPHMAKALDHGSALAAAFDRHADVTRKQIERLENIFELVGERACGKTCGAVESMIEEADQLVREVEFHYALEAGLLASAQAIAHYEIARYGTLAAWAEVMEYGKAAQLLHITLDEEKEADAYLTRLAQGGINARANMSDDDGMGVGDDIFTAPYIL